MTSNPRAENYVVLNYNQESSESEQFNPEVPPETRGALTIVRYQDLNAATETITEGSITKTLQIDSDNVLAAVGQNDDGQPTWQRLLTAQGKQVIDGGLEVDVITLPTNGAILGTDNGYIIIANGDITNLTCGTLWVGPTVGLGTMLPRLNTTSSGTVINNDLTVNRVITDGSMNQVVDYTPLFVDVSANTVDIAGILLVGGALSVNGKISDPDGTNVFDNNVAVEGTLAVDGNTTLGDANTDVTTINGRINAVDHRIMQVVESTATTETIDWTGSTAEQTFTTDCTLPDPPAYGAGDVLRFNAYGSYERTGTVNLTLRLYFGGNLVFSTGAVSVSADGDFRIEALMRRGTGGGTTNHRCTGVAYMGATPGAPTVRYDQRQISGQGNTGAKDFEFSAQFGTASASNKVLLDNLILEASTV